MSDWVAIPKNVAKSRGMSHYYSLLPCVRGHVSKRHISGSKCSCCNREDALARTQQCDDKVRLKITKAKKRYYENNKVELNRKRAIDISRSRKTDPLHRLRHRFQSRVRDVLANLKTKTSKSTEEILGCSIQFFKDHIEKQFHGSMSWENMNEWHIDHIIPCSLARTEKELLLFFKYTNLRPLMAKDNLAKSDKVQFLL